MKSWMIPALTLLASSAHAAIIDYSFVFSGYHMEEGTSFNGNGALTVDSESTSILAIRYESDFLNVEWSGVAAIDYGRVYDETDPLHWASAYFGDGSNFFQLDFDWFYVPETSTVADSLNYVVEENSFVNDYWVSGRYTKVSVGANPSVVSEPATWALLGFALAGLAGRRSRS